MRLTTSQETGIASDYMHRNFKAPIDDRLKAKVQEQDKQFAGLQGENRILAENNKEITSKLEKVIVKEGTNKKPLKSSENEPEGKLPRWQYFLAVFTG